MRLARHRRFTSPGWPGPATTPDVLFDEVTNILWMKQARGQMATATANVAVHWLQQPPLQTSAGMPANGVTA